MPEQNEALGLKILKDMFVEILNTVLSSSNNSFLSFFLIIHDFIVLYSDILAVWKNCCAALKCSRTQHRTIVALLRTGMAHDHLCHTVIMTGNAPAYVPSHIWCNMNILYDIDFFFPVCTPLSLNHCDLHSPPQGLKEWKEEMRFFDT